jgi:hypothetical protein
MSRNTVDRLLELEEPPVYRRPPKGSALDEFAGEIAAMLEEHPGAPATVILERLRPLGYAGGITVLKDRLQQLRPLLLAAKSYQRTSYLPGEIVQLDWWHSGVQIPVGKGRAGRRSGWWPAYRIWPLTPRRSLSVGPRAISARPCRVVSSGWVGCQRKP